MIQFEFPKEKHQYQQMNSAQQLRQLLKNDSSRLQIQVMYHIKISKKMYMYAKCKECNCEFRYQKKEGSLLFEMLKCTSFHVHSYRTRKHNQIIQDIIRNIPDYLPLKSAKAIFFHETQASKSQFYYFYSKIKHPCLSFNQLVKLLDSQNFWIQYEPFELDKLKYPHLLLVITPQMKKLYHQYGQFFSFDMTFHIVKDFQSGRTWKLGAFLGLSRSKKIVPFGLCLCQSLTADNYCHLFRAFREIMGSLPNIIVTDEESAIQSSLKILKEQGLFTGDHCLDNFHILRNIRKRLKNKDHLKNYSLLLKAENQFDFQRQLQRALESLDQGQVSLLNGFVHNSDRYSFSQIPNSFIGFAVSSSINQKFHDLLKDQLPFETDFTKAVLKTLKLLSQMGSKCNDFQIQKIPIEDYFAISQLKYLRYSLDRSIFTEVCRQISKSIHLDLEDVTQTSYVLKCLKTGDLFKVKNEDGWRCTCNYFVKTGIGCSHMIKIFLVNRIRLVDLIKQRWIVTKQEIKTSETIRGRRKTRRNK